MLTLHNNRGVEEKHGQQSLNIKMNTEHERRTFFPCFIRIPVITEKNMMKSRVVFITFHICLLSFESVGP